MILQWKWKRHQYGSWKVQRVIGHTKSNVKSINMTLKSSKSCWSHQSKPPLKDPLACSHSHPLPNLSFTFLNYIDNPFIVFILLLSNLYNCLFINLDGSCYQRRSLIFFFHPSIQEVWCFLEFQRWRYSSWVYRPFV